VPRRHGREQRRGGEDAAAAGADAAILTPPFYFRIPDEQLYGHFADVAASGALPVVVYNNPLYTGNNLSPALIASLMELDGVVGLKQSNDDLGQLVEALRLAEPSGRSLCTGIDSQFYAALCVGARGIFSTAAAIVWLAPVVIDSDLAALNVTLCEPLVAAKATLMPNTRAATTPAPIRPARAALLRSRELILDTSGARA